MPLVEFSTNHRVREVLGDRSALEVMTGRKPTTTAKLAMWTGVKIKDARQITAKMTVLNRYCARLERSLHRLHETVRGVQEARQRRKALKAAGGHPGMNFRVGDFVMVTSEKTQANPRRHSKLNVLWQGPYEVTGGSPPKYQVRLLGEDAIATVHWRKMVRLAGAGY